MAGSRFSVFTREDTLFGVCEALGEDFGFNATYLRVLFALGLFWNSAAALAVYAGLGALVLVSRLLVPDPPQPQETANASESGAEVDEEAQAWEELAIAA